MDTHLTTGLRIEIRPHCLLGMRQARALLWSIGVLSFSAAGTVALMGAWPVLVFAALEMGIMSAALQSSLQRGKDWQRIEIAGSNVQVSLCERGRIEVHTLTRYWTRIALRRSFSPSLPRQLLLESCGRRIEIGRFLTELERSTLHKRLAQLIGPIGQCPELQDQRDAGPALDQSYVAAGNRS
jgi:uncharacterized membrane protein